MTRTTRGSRTEMRVHTCTQSPVGTLTLVATGPALSGLLMVDQRHRPPAEEFGKRDPTPFRPVIDQLEAYFAGERTTFELPLAPVGTTFQHAVWAALAQIPYGQTVSYGHIAALIGRPGASRAVGLANGANPISIIIPCHRVVGTDGSLTGYGGGLDRKRFLLDLEKRRVVPQLFPSIEARTLDSG